MVRDTRTGGREATTAVIPGAFGLSVGDPRALPPSGFRWRALSDLARLESGHTPSRSKPEYWDGDIPWVGIRDASGNHGKVLLDTAQHVTQLGLDNSSARLLPTGTVCLSRTASVGFVVTMGRPMATSQDFVNWVCGPELDRRYLHYLLMAEQDTIRRIAYGSVHPTMYYPDAKALHVCVPSLGEQEAIAEMLGALDDKIAANDHALALSEKLTRAHFAQAADRGLRVRLGDIALLLSRGVAPTYLESGMTVLNQKCIRDQRVSLVPARSTLPLTSRLDRVLQVDDVLVNSTGQGTLGRVARWIRSERVTVDSHITIVRIDRDRTDQRCAGYAILEIESQIANLAEGSTGQTELRRELIANMEIRLPQPSAQSRLGEQLSRFDRLALALADESQKLAETRDELLPLLMSGKVRVKDAEKIVEGAL